MHVPNLHFTVKNFVRPRDNTAIVKDLKPKEIYKYLVLTESDGIQHFSKRENFLKEYFCRVRSILRSKLNACNKIHAINS